jgi:hypothetical protein
LEKHHARVPDRWRTTEFRQKHLADHWLDLKEQPGTDEQRQWKQQEHSHLPWTSCERGQALRRLIMDQLPSVNPDQAIKLCNTSCQQGYTV